MPSILARCGDTTTLGTDDGQAGYTDTFNAEFAKCYAGADHPSECVLQRADYLECLHHTKEVRRRRAVYRAASSHFIHCVSSRSSGHKSSNRITSNHSSIYSLRRSKKQWRRPHLAASWA